MAKKPKLHECDATDPTGARCGHKFKSGAGGRLATPEDPRNLCPMHNQRLIRTGETGSAQPLREGVEPTVPVKAFVPPALKKEITKRAKAKGLSTSEFIGQHLTAVFKPA